MPNNMLNLSKYEMHIYSTIRIVECLSYCLRNHVLAAHRSEFVTHVCVISYARKFQQSYVSGHVLHTRETSTARESCQRKTHTAIFKHYMVQNEADIYSSYLDVIGICEEHGQSVHPHAPTCCWGQTILQCCTEVFIH